MKDSSEHISTSPTLSLTLAIEETERNAWRNMYQESPKDFNEHFSLETLDYEELTLLTVPALPLGLFNKVYLGGLYRPLSDNQIAYIKDFFVSRKAQKFLILVTDFSQPQDVENRLKNQGFELSSLTDKVYCNPQTSQIPTDSLPGGQVTEEVNPTNAPEWADFICTTYEGLPNQPWLIALVNRKGWYHVVLRKQGKIIACRSMYIDENQRAWLGIDAPIPGLMTDNFEADYFLCRHLLQIAQAKGVTFMNSCVEAVSESKDSPAYQYYYRLGFAHAYTRRYFINV
jgi:hypothetical protein